MKQTTEAWEVQPGIAAAHAAPATHEHLTNQGLHGTRPNFDAAGAEIEAPEALRQTVVELQLEAAEYVAQGEDLIQRARALARKLSLLVHNQVP